MLLGPLGWGRSKRHPASLRAYLCWFKGMGGKKAWGGLSAYHQLPDASRKYVLFNFGPHKRTSSNDLFKILKCFIMSQLPETFEELMIDLSDGRSPHKLKKIATLMIANGDSVSLIWNTIIDFDLVDDMARHGWIDRDGSFWGCAYAAHERLLLYLGLTIEDVENRGWVRLSFQTYQCTKRLSPEQRNALLNRGIPLSTEDTQD